MKKLMISEIAKAVGGVANGEADKYAGVSEVKKFIEAANGAAI